MSRDTFDPTIAYSKSEIVALVGRGGLNRLLALKPHGIKRRCGFYLGMDLRTAAAVVSGDKASLNRPPWKTQDGHIPGGPILRRVEVV
mgnify:CR=1 FL=1